MMEIRKGFWRPMLASDLGSVSRISDAVHDQFSEEEAVYAERLSLYPAGCFVHDRKGTPDGYLIAHPWLRGGAPPLNKAIGAIPQKADTFCLHDVALLLSARGMGAGKAAVDLAIRQARAGDFSEITLVAVGGADRFWSRHGFTHAEGEPAPYGPGKYLMRRSL